MMRMDQQAMPSPSSDESAPRNTRHGYMVTSSGESVTPSPGIILLFSPDHCFRVSFSDVFIIVIDK